MHTNPHLKHAILEAVSHPPATRKAFDRLVYEGFFEKGVTLNRCIILFLLIVINISWATPDPREKSHSMNVVPFLEKGMQKYYVAWSSSSGSDAGWQHDIYHQVISFTSAGEIIFNTEARRFIGTGFDEAQEPVKIALDPRDNTLLSVWEDGSGASVDIRGQLHKPDGTILRSNWIISGGNESQHSPAVVHLDGYYLVSLTDEAPPADYAMNELRILDEKTGDQVNSMDLTPKEADHWWTVATSNHKNIAFIGWGDDVDFYGSVIKTSSGAFTKNAPQLYLPGIEQYYYSVAWLGRLSKFIAIAKSNRNSSVCLIDTNGIKTAFASIPNAPITRETAIAVRWDEHDAKYQISYTSATRDVALLSVTTDATALVQLYKNIQTDTDWPTTGIACQFVQDADGTDLWDSDKKVLIAHHDENSNNALYHLFDLRDFEAAISSNNPTSAGRLFLFPACPNPFNATTTIHYSIDREEFVKIQVFDLRGREIRTLVNENIRPGDYRVTLAAVTLSSGIYVVTMRTSTRVFSRKILLLK